MIRRFARRVFDGERVVGTSPKISIRIGDEAYRRPLMFTGRALTEDALILNARHGIGHLQLFGRHVSSGVVTGLEMSHYTRVERNDAGEPQPEAWLQITPGAGITHMGDDVSLPGTAHVRLDNVRAPGSEDPARGVGFFVLQPVEIIHEAGRDPHGQCKWDREKDPFEDEQLVDGCRVVFQPWPEEELGPAPVAGPLFRNRASYALFDYEVQHYVRHAPDLDPVTDMLPAPDPDAPDAPIDTNTRRRYRHYEPLPWEGLGVPLALTYIDEAGEVIVLDRHAVVRKGGAPLTVRPILATNGSPLLWEARIQQFVAHVQDLVEDLQTEEPGEGEEEDDEGPVLALRDHFEVLPPVGLLPKEALDLDTMSSDYLPSQFITDAVPVPEEQLEVALNASAALTPFDLYKPEKMKLLVPVPQAVFEPDLLERELVDPIFLQTIRRLVGQIRTVLLRRNRLRDMARLVIGAIERDDIPTFPADVDLGPDEGRFPPGQGLVVPDPTLREFGTEARAEIENLVEWIGGQGRIAARDYALLEPEKIGEPDDPETGERGFAGLEDFILDMERKVRSADDRLSMAFVNAEADIYRLRQLLLGNVKASRLATSPVMGKIVEGRTATPTADDVERYFRDALAQVEEAPEGDAAGGAGDDGGTEEVVEPVIVEAAAGLGTREFIRSRRIVGEELLFATAFRKADTPVAKRQSREKSVVERVYESPASEAKHNTVVTKANVFSAVADLELHVEPTVTAAPAGTGLYQKDDYEALKAGFRGLDAEVADTLESILDDRTRKAEDFDEDGSDDFAAVDVTPLTEQERETLEGDEDHIRAVNALLRDNRGRNKVTVRGDALAKNIREGLFDPDPSDGDEANYFSVGVAALEHGFGVIRTVDRGLDNYRRVLAQSRRVATKLRSIAREWQDELKRTEDRLKPLRHDVLVTRALYEEERTRVDTINRHRRSILEAHVTSVAFVRPRLSEARLDAPEVQLHPEYVSPVPACLAEDFEAADELDAMLDVLREVPISWFKSTRPLLRRLDHPSKVRRALELGAERARRLMAAEPPNVLQSTSSFNVRAHQEAVVQVVHAHQQYQVELYNEKRTVDLGAVDSKAWSALRASAEQRLSLADLVEGGRGGSRLARDASALMERFEDVAVCLYERCRGIDPAVRLRWANTISIFDQPVDLRQLDRLPGSHQLDHVLLRDLQSLVDWLFDQVDVAASQPRKLMNDLVRVCILLASHAPVSSIVRGSIRRPTKGRIGDFIDLNVHKGLVKIGMVATIFQQEVQAEPGGPTVLVAAQGVVQDIGPDSARIQVTTTSGTGDEFSVAQGAEVKFFQGMVPAPPNAGAPAPSGASAGPGAAGFGGASAVEFGGAAPRGF